MSANVPTAPQAAPTTKCSTCKVEKLYSEFNKTNLRRRLNRKSSPDGNIGHCKDCVRISNMQRRYKMSEDAFNKMLESQNHKCAIKWCTTKLDKANANIDHNHYNKKVRGLLCISCNTSLGGLGDSVEKVLEAAVYLTGTTDSLSERMDRSTKRSLEALAKWYEQVKTKKQPTSSSSTSSTTSQ